MTDLKSTILLYALRVPTVLIAITIHEVSHGFAAYKLGDTTARDTGRLSLNPLRHLTLLGVVFMLVFGFGFAKPVPIDTRRFRRPKLGMALTALAGPLSNVVLSLIGIIAGSIILKIPYGGATFAYYYQGYALGMVTNMQLTYGFWILFALYSFFYVFGWMNMSFAIFNLLPIPPLDGSRVLLVFLPARAYFNVMRYEGVIMIILFALLWLGVLDGPLVTMMNNAYNWAVNLVRLIPFLR